MNFSFFAINFLSPSNFILITLLPQLDFKDFILITYPFLHDLDFSITEILILITPTFDFLEKFNTILIFPIPDFFFDLSFSFFGFLSYLEIQVDNLEKVELDYQSPNEPNIIDGCDPDNPGSPFLSEDFKIFLHVISQIFLKIVLDFFRYMAVFNAFMIFWYDL